MCQAIDNVGIAVSELDAALEFYESLGFECERFSDQDARVALADDAYLYVFETDADGAVERDGDRFDNPVGIDHVSVRVDDADAAYESLTDDGVDFFQAPTTDEDWDIRMIGTRDPGGNVVYLVEYL